MKEFRSARRRRTNKAGIVKFGVKELTVLLRDVSRTGARVRLVNMGELPHRVRLVAPLEKVDAECIIVWRRGNDYGLQFESLKRR